jgi:Pyrimidine dimer DNA glycosylase
MRLWSIHPSYLDRQGLTACWREALLAQAVIAGRTKGYRSHPQLERFREHPDPVGAICHYLHGVAAEADARGYRYDRSRVDLPAAPVALIDVTSGQVDVEWSWLQAKLAQRSPDLLRRWEAIVRPAVHPSFREVPGPVASWERLDPGSAPPSSAGPARRTAS